MGTLKSAHGSAIPILNKYPREVRNACLHAVLEMNAHSSIIPDSKKHGSPSVTCRNGEPLFSA